MQKISIHRLYCLGAVACLAAKLCVFTASAQFQYQRIKSFGFPELSGTGPRGMAEGSDGVLYGTTRDGGTGAYGTVFKINRDGSGFAELHGFSGALEGGQNPAAALLVGSDGALYGTTLFGGHSAAGTVFKINTNGTGFTVLYGFGPGGGGGAPQSRLIEGSDGALYGVASGGGLNGGGTVFSLHKDGSGIAELHSFPDTIGNNSFPLAILEGSDGALNGITGYGGIGYYGTVFKLNKDGSDYAVLWQFTGSAGDGADPSALVEGGDGALYGATFAGGDNNWGTVFTMNKDGSGYRVLLSFTGIADGGSPSVLLAGSDGVLYGQTANGGLNHLGVFYRVNLDGSGYTNLHNFTYPDGNLNAQFASLIEGADGILYGPVFRLRKDGTGFTVLRTFSATGGDGSHPAAPLVEGSDGALYGTTAADGINGNGAVFRINKDGSGYRSLHQFNLSGGSQDSVIEGRDGLLYGTTGQDGTNGYGTVFALSKDGRDYTVIHSFPSVEGYVPFAPLIEASDGALYGTAGLPSGGPSGDWGAVFKLNKDGSGFEMLHHFRPGSGNGGQPGGRPLEASDGVIYGVTSDGGAANYGTVFKLNKDGSGFVVLRNFSAPPAADSPNSLIEGSEGTLFGTTDGRSGGAGVVFKMNKDGTGYAIVRTFTAGDGPSALVEGRDGSLYGTTGSGGDSFYGTIFKLNKNGSGYAVLHSYSGRATGDGSFPSGGLLLGRDGALYGPTSYGGDMIFGTIFVLRPLPWMLEPVRSAGGMLIRIASVPGSTNQVLRASALGSSWLTLTNLVVPTNGVAEFTDPAPPQPAGFYRAVLAEP